jgi:hypothetical protein
MYAAKNPPEAPEVEPSGHSSHASFLISTGLDNTPALYNTVHGLMAEHAGKVNYGRMGEILEAALPERINGARVYVGALIEYLKDEEWTPAPPPPPHEPGPWETRALQALGAVATETPAGRNYIKQMAMWDEYDALQARAIEAGFNLDIDLLVRPRAGTDEIRAGLRARYNEAKAAFQQFGVHSPALGLMPRDRY